MNISGISLSEFTAITNAVSARTYNGNIVVEENARDTGSRKPRCTARLKVTDSRGAGARVSWSGRHGPWACWHAYRDVLAALFAAHPDAVIRTSQALYRGRAGFLAAYPATAGRNIGSQFQPAYMIELCECADDDARDVPRQEPDFGYAATQAVADYACNLWAPSPDYSDTGYAAEREAADARVLPDYSDIPVQTYATVPLLDRIDDVLAGCWTPSAHP